MFDGLWMNPTTMPLLSNARTRSISAENPTGEKGKGGLAETGTGANCARKLGRGWKVSPSMESLPGSTLVLADIEGPGAIQSIWTAGYMGRDVILRFYWDDQERPSVECPLSDFFAGGWFDDDQGGKFSQLTSQMVNVSPNHGMSCFWLMPFRKHCRITAENRGEKTRYIYYQINYTLTEIPEDCAYFCAQFRRLNPVKKMSDYVILDGVHGKGHYVGTALSVGLNGHGGWWGEGEIKFYMDGDTEGATICGTGTEDYFLGAYNWDVNHNYTTYCTPYAGMYHMEKPDGLYASQQRFSMYRWHVMDPVRFESDLRVTIQDLGWYPGFRYLPREDDFASVAYWYQTLPVAPFPELPDVDDLFIS